MRVEGRDILTYRRFVTNYSFSHYDFKDLFDWHCSGWGSARSAITSDLHFFVQFSLSFSIPYGFFIFCFFYSLFNVSES